ncbi:hypothetical protein LMIY3S_03712 [Labrys miyagiensis]
MPSLLGSLASFMGSQIVAAINGGTGQGSYAVGDILAADTTTTLSRIADVAGGNVLRSGGVGALPSYGKVGLTTHVTGTLPAANGGLGAALTGDPTIVMVPFNIQDSASGAIGTGIKGDIFLDFPGTITKWTLLADQSGSIVVNIWKQVFASYPATVTQKITASAPPTISGATTAQSSTLTGWTTTFAAGDCLRINVDSASTITRCLLALTCKRS